mmetsp:Transcript_34785/g.90507  ORF Transcript_34785/g.90507 Transcript_34785/m.90507 type:complete len:229 (-) Transcript_34785:6-692(-)
MQKPGPHPDRQRAHLREVVEATERDRSIGFLRWSQRHHWGRLWWCVAQEALWQVHQLLRREARCTGRVSMLVRDPIVHPGQARGVRIAHPRHDDRRRSSHEHGQAVVAGVPREVHEHVNAIAVYHARDLVVRQTKCAPPSWNHALKEARLIVLVGHIAVARDVYEGRVMIPQGGMDEVRHRMHVEVWRHISHAQWPAPSGCAHCASGGGPRRRGRGGGGRGGGGRGGR